MNLPGSSPAPSPDCHFSFPNFSFQLFIPERGHDPAEVEAFITGLFLSAELVEIPFFHFRHYPLDSDDTIFLPCALNGSATHLVSYDRHLLDVGIFYDEFVTCRPPSSSSMSSPSPISSLQSPAAQPPPTLAWRLGTTPHLSPLLLKAKRLGLSSPEDLERLAIHRGLRYYDPYGDSAASLAGPSKPQNALGRDIFTNEELAVALLSPAAPYSMQRLRMSAAMMAADGNNPETIARLAKWERSESIIRHLASCGRQAEPENPFWNELLARLPESTAHPVDRLPHLSRFVAMTGLTRSGQGPEMKWIRPVADRVR